MSGLDDHIGKGRISSNSGSSSSAYIPTPKRVKETNYSTPKRVTFANGGMYLYTVCALFYYRVTDNNSSESPEADRQKRRGKRVVDSPFL